jgi:hypothetical protein
VLALTSYKTAGFQRKLKMGVMVFIGFTAAYDTVWREFSLCQAVEFTEKYVVKPFLSSLSW